MASAAIRHSSCVFKLAPLIMTAPAGLSNGRKGMRDLEGAVGIGVENLHRVFSDCGGDPSATFGPLFRKGLEL